MSNEEKILAILNSVLLSIADLKVNQIETNARLDKLESMVTSLESDKAPIVPRMDKLISGQVSLYEKTDRLEARVLKVEAAQTYMNRKIDALAVEIAKILKYIYTIQEEYKEQIKLITAEVEGLSSITKENMFSLAKIKHTST